MTTRTPRSFEDEFLAELNRPRTLSSALFALDDFAQLRTGKIRRQVSASVPMAALLVSTPTNPTRVSVVHPEMPSTPLLDAITVVPDVLGAVQPMSVEFTSAADVVDEGVASDEATLTYTAGDVTNLEYISHHIPVTRQALKYNAGLRTDIDVFLAGGVLVKLEDRVGAALAAGTGYVAQAFDTDRVTTIRRAIAKAQTAMRELGPGVITVALSPNDHASLDLEAIELGGDMGAWPCRFVSSPAIPAGEAFLGRLNLAVFLYTSDASIVVGAGYIDDQFTKNRITVQASTAGLTHVAAPASIVKADLDDDLS